MCMTKLSCTLFTIWATGVALASISLNRTELPFSVVVIREICTRLDFWLCQCKESKNHDTNATITQAVATWQFTWLKSSSAGGCIIFNLKDQFLLFFNEPIQLYIKGYVKS